MTSNEDIVQELRMGQVRIEENIKQMQKDIAEIKKQLENDYVHKHTFEPVQKIVYGVVGIIVMTVFTALVALVVNSGGLP